jgi:hypothetical protein
MTMSLAKRDSPSAQRNKEPIWNILSTKVTPQLGSSSSDNNNKKEPIQVLEIAAGCGVHSHYFALQMLHQSGIPFQWYPSDPDADSRASIQAYIHDEPKVKDNLHSPVEVLLDDNGIIPKDDNQLVRQKTFQLMLCINMIHISPWSATLGLLKVAGEQLANGGILYLYGPYKLGGTTAESNL